MSQSPIVTKGTTMGWVDAARNRQRRSIGPSNRKDHHRKSKSPISAFKKVFCVSNQIIRFKNPSTLMFCVQTAGAQGLWLLSSQASPRHFSNDNARLSMSSNQASGPAGMVAPIGSRTSLPTSVPSIRVWTSSGLNCASVKTQATW